jgi:hypothetical protein
VLYELLAGRRPFVAATAEELLVMQVRATPAPLSSIRPDLPAALYRLVEELMAKDPAARPSDAAQVLIRVQAISAEVVREAPAHEADRETFSVLESEEQPPPSLQTPTMRVDPAGAGDFVISSGPEHGLASGAGAAGLRGAGGAGLGGPGRLGPREVPPAPPPPRSPAPPPAGWNDGVPQWPGKARPRRRRRPGRWRGLLSTLITVAIVAGVGVYWWMRTHESLKVVNVSVTAPPVPAGCDVTDTLTGTIVTNGEGGTITYKWIRDPGGAPTNASTVTVASGQDTVQVSLAWHFTGNGTTQASAELAVLTPNSAVSSISGLTYSCAR